MTAIAESGAPRRRPRPAISAETQRLLATDAKGLDAELLDIYLDRGRRGARHDRRAIARELERNPGDREALRTVRRQFHTLKGSGRMVGLTELGELAFDVEKIHNRLLEEERAVTPAVLAMIDVAETSFRRWVGALQRQRRVGADPAELHAAIGAVEAELLRRPSRDRRCARTRRAPPVAAASVAAPPQPGGARAGGRSR